ncbi:Oryzain beta chain, partial [Nymphaea thermarum]
TSISFEVKRFKIFKDNLLDQHNVGSRSYKLGLNYFADLTNEENRSTYTMAENREPKPSPSRCYWCSCASIQTEQDYPYMVVDGDCNITKKNTRVVTIDGYEYAPQCDEKAMLKVVAHQPLSVYIEASKDFQRLVGNSLHHSSHCDIFKEKCGTNLNHAVVVVGMEPKLM